MKRNFPSALRPAPHSGTCVRRLSLGSLHHNSRTSRKSASHVTSRNRKLTPTAEFFDIAIITLVDYFRLGVRLASARLRQKNPRSNLSFWRLPCVRHALQRGPQVPAGACDVIVGFRNVHSSFPQGSLCYPTYIAINKLANLRSFPGTPIPHGDCPDSRHPPRNLREQRRNEPTHPLRSRPSSVAGPAARGKKTRARNSGQLRSSAQH